MKKMIPILLLSFLAAGCYEEVLIPTEDKDPVLVMNAQMNNLEEAHTLYLSVSLLGKVEPLPGASVKVYVNDVLAAEAVERIDEDPWNCSAYDFAAEFRPGDRVRVEAVKDALHAVSTLAVPEAAAVSSVDTSSVRIADFDDMTDYLQMKVRFQDLPGDTWYGVDHRLTDVWEYLDEDGNVVPEYTVRSDLYGYIETDYDPVISEGAGNTPGGDLAALLSASNYYHCFSDTAIADQECTLRVLTYPWYFYLPERRSGIYVPETMDYEEGYTTVMNMPARVHRSCYFRLRTLDFAQYHYLKALNNLEAFGTEVSFLVEPTTLPSNVEGGLGFVGIETITEYLYAEQKTEYGPEDTILRSITRSRGPVRR